MVVDADVYMPEMDSVAVAGMINNPFTQERADGLREYFMQDGKLVTQYVRTKQDYDAMIEEAKKGHEVDGELVFDSGDERYIERLTEERKGAPDEDVANLITDYPVGGDGFSGRLIVKGEHTGNLFCDENNFWYTGVNPFRVEADGKHDDDYPTVEINMSEQEAVEAAERLLKELNVSGMAVKETGKAYFYDCSYREYDPWSVPDYGGYLIKYMREFGGMMPVDIESYGMSDRDQYDMSPPLNAEELRIAVDEYGNIRNFIWQNPTEITEILSEHVDMLPFEDIMARFREFSRTQFSYMKDSAAEFKRMLKVSGITLSLFSLPAEDNGGGYTYSPCWAFEYKNVIDYTQEDLDRLEGLGITPLDESEAATNYLIFTAADGASVSSYSAEAFERAQKFRAGADGGG